MYPWNSLRKSAQIKAGGARAIGRQVGFLELVPRVEKPLTCGRPLLEDLQLAFSAGQSRRRAGSASLHTAGTAATCRPARSFPSSSVHALQTPISAAGWVSSIDNHAIAASFGKKTNRLDGPSKPVSSTNGT
jgi:hypothetical protein